MERCSLSLDTVICAALFAAGQRTPAFKSNQAREVFRFLLCRLYDQGRGNVMKARITLAQTTLARKLDLSGSGWASCWAACRKPAGWSTMRRGWLTACMARRSLPRVAS